jgi:guanine deaminase
MTFVRGEDGEAAVVGHDDGVLISENGKITDIMNVRDFEAQGNALSECEDLRPCIIFPGFIDTHLHMPQLGIIGSYSDQLLDWLQRHAFPAESAFADPDFAAAQAEQFLNRVIASGTTSGQIFTTVHAHSCDSLFVAAKAKKMAIVAGKVMMDRNAPKVLTQAPVECAKDCEELINRWHGKGRLRYALTPRFAITSSDEQLALCGELLQSHTDVLLQTHLSENLQEIAEVRRLFPSARDYLDVYERHGLNKSQSTFAHAIHLTPDERERLLDAGAKIAFCPSSNLFLGSGLLDIQAIPKNSLSIASDVGGGTGISMLHTCVEGYKVAQAQGQQFHPLEAFYAITAGNAATLGLGDELGQLKPGYTADLVVVDPAKPNPLAERLETCNDLTEELFALMMLSDDRSIRRCYISGKLAYEGAC